MNLKEVFANAIFIKPKLNLRQWAEQYRVLSQESSALFGRFKTLAYQKEPMEVISDSNVREVVLMWSSQLGKSEILNNTIGYFIHQDPSTILMVLPTEDMAEDYSKRRLSPMFRDCKELGALINDREANNTILIKNFKGGNLALVGSNSPSKLASKPIKVLVVDEVDRCENTKEGHSIDLARMRTITYFDRKIILVSTPTITGQSLIEAEFNASDKRRFFVPCPKCGFLQTLEFDNVKWDKDEKGEAILDSVRYECAHCQKPWSEAQKNKAVEKGRWQATAQSAKVGFHLNTLYSPFFTLKDITKAFLDSKDDAHKLQVFVNTIKAQSFEPPSVKFEENVLFERREDYTPTTLSDDILFITAGVDVQADRVEVEFKGWAMGFENWGIKHSILYGDTKEHSVWSALYAELKQVFRTKGGRKLRNSIALIDSGFNKERVYEFVKLDSRFFPSKGASETNTKKEFISASKRENNGVRLFNIGTYAGKAEIFKLLRVSEKGAGYCHFASSYTLEYFLQLTSEKLMKTKTPQGYNTYRWQKVRERNEALDISVLCLAGAKILKLDSVGMKLKKT